MDFVFYDTETTGISTKFDQILQFGAIRTDGDLREIDRFEIRCRLNPDVVPAPGALKVTGITVEQITDPSLPSQYEMMVQIREKLLEWSPAVFIGHNTMRFDEDLLRQGFYKSLLPIYLTNTNNNCRTDTLRILQAVDLLAPDTLNIPRNHRNKKVFKLDQLAPANGFNHIAAHDAMGDVEATIHMCRLVAERCPDLWSHFVRTSRKSAAQELIAEEEMFLVADFYFNNPSSRFVTRLGDNPDNGSETFVYDLSVNPADLLGLSDNDLAERLTTSPKLIRSIKTNAAPIAIPVDQLPAHLKPSVGDTESFRRNRRLLLETNGLLVRLITVFMSTREDWPESEHVEEQIYNGFPSWKDNQMMEQFHIAPWEERLALVRQLDDSRMRTLGKRLIASEAAHVLPETDQVEYEKFVAQRCLLGSVDNKWLTLPVAIQETENMLEDAVGIDEEILSGLLAYLHMRLQSAMVVLD